MEENKEKLAKLIKNFIKDTIYGEESGLYKIALVNNNFDLSNNNQMNNIITMTTANYFNNCYVSLIKKNDEYVIKKFNEMSKIMSHSMICLLNIISTIKLKIHHSIDRNKLNLSNYDNYMKSVNNQMKLLLDDIFEDIINSISHKCYGEDINKCDPDDLMFKIN